MVVEELLVVVIGGAVGHCGTYLQEDVAGVGKTKKRRPWCLRDVLDNEARSDRSRLGTAYATTPITLNTVSL